MDKDEARWLLLLGLVGAGLALWTATGPLALMPHVSDEIAYTLQARLYAEGLRSGLPIEAPWLRLYSFWNTEGPTWSPFPPGWPALLALGEVLGLPQLVNPALVGLLPWLGGRLGRALGLSLAERLGAAALLAFSPAVWVMGASRMSHTSVLCALLAAMVIAAERPARALPWAGLGGLVGWVVLARPLDAALVGGPLLLWGLWRAPPAGRAALLLLPGLGAGLLLAENLDRTGDLWTFPMDAWFDAWVEEQGRQGCNRLGFGPEIGCAPTAGSYGHDPGKAWASMRATAGRFDRMLLGWPGGSLLVLAGALLWLRERSRALAGVALAVGAVLVGAHALYWSPGMAYGARFWHPLLVPAALLGGLALARLPRRLGPAALAMLCLGAAPSLWSALSRDYWCTGPALRDALQDSGLEEGVLLLNISGQRSASWPALGVEDFQCDAMLTAGSAFALEDPASERWIIRYVPGHEERSRDWLREHHPDRSAWWVEIDVNTGRIGIRALAQGE